ncbi:MAG: HAD family hydrolase [Cyanobacteriota bacterium]|jgi:phosphoglycolate phosphatase-like HAD superfamily hydrolase|nr:HAD family hydrolase [Cyanobacteriota bacterium]
MSSVSAAPSPLLVFDFDGVLVDGMAEYWWSARRAAMALDPALALPVAAPGPFVRLRPLIHKGWEMVLLALELAQAGFAEPLTPAAYQLLLEAALARTGLTPEALQQGLEEVRRQAIAGDAAAWLALHRFFPGVPERLGRLAAEGSDWIVLTTKGGAFAERLLAAAGLKPAAVFGHEQGSKPQVLARLLRDAPLRPLWFLEDRRPTLEQVRATPGLAPVRCYLVSWGYLAPGDQRGLATRGIRWLEPECFAGPLAAWP